jgi:hypothetical protein
MDPANTSAPAACHSAQQRAPEPIDSSNPNQILTLFRNQLNLPVRGKLLLSIDPDATIDANDVRSSVLLDVLDNGEIVLAQTEPMILKSMVGSEVIISSTSRGDSGPTRQGLRARITRIEKLSLLFERQETVVLLALIPPVQLISVSVRLGVRVELDGHSLLSFSAKNLELVPLNISIGGVGFFVPKDRLKVGDLLQITLNLPGQSAVVAVRVVRVNHSNNRLDYTGASFLEQEKEFSFGPKLRRALQSAIMAEQARQIARAKGIDWN